MRAHDALRCAPPRRVLPLSRLHGFHLYVILPSQALLFVRVFGKTTKKGYSRDYRNRFLKKGYFAVLTRTCRVECFLHPLGAVLRAAGISSFGSALFLLSLVEQRARVHSLFAAPSGTADAAG